jgi:hypothetical protein
MQNQLMVMRAKPITGWKIIEIAVTIIIIIIWIYHMIMTSNSW